LLPARNQMNTDELMPLFQHKITSEWQKNICLILL
jgi:hypothetical protein